MENADSPDIANKKASNVMEASNLFNAGDYQKCEEVLQLLQSNTSAQHPVLKHNFAVIRFYKTGCIDYGPLLKELNELTITSEDVASTSKPKSRPSICNNAAIYNKAVIYFHQHMYSTALRTLEPLIDQLEKIDKNIGSLVATLQLQLLISTNELNKAEAFLDYLQSKLDYETTPSSVPEENIASEILSECDTNRSKKCEFQLLALLTQVLNRRTVAIPEQNSPDFAALKAHQYYIMKDFQMASKQLLKIHNDFSVLGVDNMALRTCIANNMGVIHLRVRHYAIAARFFQNAIEFDQKGLGNVNSISLYSKGSSRSCELMYNLGIAHLHLRKPQEAFKCLLIPLKFYHSNPRLWLRAAEACIMNYELTLKESNNERFWNFIKNHKSTAGEMQPTLAFASFALKNALSLARLCKNQFHEVTETELEKTTLTDDWRSAYDNNFCNPSSPFTKESLNQLLAAIYAAYSYVSLKLGDYFNALEMAQNLIKTDNITDAYKFLGSMYVGQALVQLKRPMEVRSYFDPTFVNTLNALDFETKDWQVKSLDAAHNLIRYNLAVALLSQNDYDNAKALLVTLTHPIVARNAYSLILQIDKKYSEIRVMSTINLMKS